MLCISHRSESGVREGTDRAIARWTVALTWGPWFSALPSHKHMMLRLLNFNPVLLTRGQEDEVMWNSWMIFRHDCHCLWHASAVLHGVFVPSPRVSGNVRECVWGISAQVLSGKAEMRGGDGVRNGQLQHLLLLSSSHFNISVSASPSRRNVECVGE